MRPEKMFALRRRVFPFGDFLTRKNFHYACKVAVSQDRYAPYIAVLSTLYRCSNAVACKYRPRALLAAAGHGRGTRGLRGEAHPDRAGRAARHGGSAIRRDARAGAANPHRRAAPARAAQCRLERHLARPPAEERPL